MSSKNLDFLLQLENLLKSRKKDLPENSYTSSLFKKGLDKILQKVGEESTEFIIDAKNANRERTISECADLLFHTMIALVESNIEFSEIVSELEKRHNK